jgi:hypothetical protein
VDKGILENKNMLILSEVTERASKEMTIELTLDKIDKEWTRKKFHLKEYKNSYVLLQPDDIFIALDDCIV